MATKRKKDDAEVLLRNMPLVLTGCPLPNMTLVGVSESVKGAKIVVSAPIPPAENVLASVRENPTTWNVFLSKLGAIAGFDKMTNAERAAWLEANQTSSTGDHIAEVDPSARITLLAPGDSDSNQFVTDVPDLGGLLSAGPLSFTEFLAYLDVRSATSNIRVEKPLTLLRQFWKVDLSPPVEFTQFDGKGVLLDACAGIVHSSHPPAQAETSVMYVKVLDGMHIKAPESFSREREEICASLRRHYHVRPATTTCIAHLSSGHLKSLLQKLIRFSPRKVWFPLTEHNNEENTTTATTVVDKIIVPAEEMLAETCIALSARPLSFVPDLATSLNGIHSLAKRLVVTMFEDAWPLYGLATEAVIQLLGFALVSRVLTDWFPPENVLQAMIDCALAALNSGVACTFDFARGGKVKPYSLLKGVANSQMQYASALLDHLRSFDTDLLMVRCIASYTDYIRVFSLEEKEEKQNRPECMPIFHCLDQHCRPDMAYYYSCSCGCSNDATSAAATNTSTCLLPPPLSNAQPFSPLFNALFRQVTGFNPRRTIYKNDHEFETQPFIAATRHAQKCSWLQGTSASTVERPCVLGKVIQVEYSLHADWVYAMIGHIEVRVGRTDYIVIVKRDTPLTLEVVRKPARKAVEERISVEDEKKAKALGRARLEEGVPLTSTTYCPPSVKGKKGILVGEKLLLCASNADVKTIKQFVTEREKAEKEDQKTDEDLAVTPIARKKGTDGVNRKRARSTTEEALVTEWEQLRHLKLVVPVHPVMKERGFATITQFGRGVEEGWETTLAAQLTKVAIPVLHRTLQFLTGYEHHVELGAIGREGGGTDTLPRFEDIATFQLLLQIAAAAPGALQVDRHSSHRFKVPVPPLLWYIRDHVIKPHLYTRLNPVAVAVSSAPPPSSTSTVDASEATQATSLPNSKVKVGKKSVSNTTAAATTTKMTTSKSKTALKTQWELHDDEQKRVLRPDQKEGVELMISRFHRGEKASALFTSTGSGKTLMLTTMLKYLYDIGQLPKYVIFTAPAASLDNAFRELSYFFVNICVVLKVKDLKDKLKNIPKSVTVLREAQPVPFSVLVVEHDSLRRSGELEAFMPDAVLCVDEFHKMLAPTTQRTQTAQRLAYNARFCFMLSATPSIDSKLFSILPWLKLLTPYEVTPKNLFNAMATAYSAVIETGISVFHHSINVQIPVGSEYWKLASHGLGGTAKTMDNHALQRLLVIAYEHITSKMVDLSLRLLRRGRKCFVVCENAKHQEAVLQLLLSRSRAPFVRSDSHGLRELSLGLSSSSSSSSSSLSSFPVTKDLEADDVFVMSSSNTLTLTPTLVRMAKVHDYRVVLGQVRLAEGFSLSTLDVMITSVYPSNSATRVQMEGRINRIGSEAPRLDYYVVSGGLLDNVLKRQEGDDNFQKVLRDLAVVIK